MATRTRDGGLDRSVRRHEHHTDGVRPGHAGIVDRSWTTTGWPTSGPTVPVTRQPSMTWSGDPTEERFSSATGRAKPSSTLAPTTLTSLNDGSGLELHPRFSPDGRRIAWVRDNNLWVYDLDAIGGAPAEPTTVPTRFSTESSTGSTRKNSPAATAARSSGRQTVRPSPGCGSTTERSRSSIWSTSWTPTPV